MDSKESKTPMNMKWGKGAKAQRGVAKLCRTLHNKAAKAP